MYIYPLMLMSLMMSVLGERSIFPENGYYSYHPSYYHDLPPNRPLPSKIPFGMPMGGYSAEGRGPPFGLVAFYFEVRSDTPSDRTTNSITCCPSSLLMILSHLLQAYGRPIDLNSPWNIFLLKQLIRLSSEITSKFIPVDETLMDGPLIWK